MRSAIHSCIAFAFLASAAAAQWTDHGAFIQADDATPPVIVTDSGALGVGTTAPSAKLHVAGDTYWSIGEGLRLLGDLNYWGTNRDARIFRMIDDGGSNANVDGGIVFEAATSSDGQTAPVFVLRRAGTTVWAGVGVRAPAEPFRVQGGRLTGTGTLSSSGTTIYGTGTLFKSQLRGGAEIYVGSVSRAVQSISNDGELVLDLAFDPPLSGASFSYTLPLFAVLDNGNVGIGAVRPVSRFVVTNRGFVGSSAWTATIDSATSDASTVALNLRNYDAQSLFFARGDGNIGIGTTSPSSKLDISGELSINGSPVISSSRGWVGGTLQSSLIISKGTIFLSSGSGVATGTLSGNSDRVEAGGPWRFQDDVEILGSENGSYLNFGGPDAKINFGSGFTPDKDLNLNLGDNGDPGTFKVNGDMIVTGNLQVLQTFSKASGTFRIDHPLEPEEKYLYHSFVESPDMLNVYSGNVETDGDGNAWVALPDYFEALNEDFRYQLTPIGTFAQAIVAKEIRGNRFLVRTDKPFVKVSWQVTGNRKDAWARQHPVEPEVTKRSRR